MPDKKEDPNSDKFGWNEDDFIVLSPDGQPADPFAELQEEIDKIDEKLGDFEDDDE